MHRVYILALFVAMVAMVSVTADKEIAFGQVKVEVMAKGGSLKCTATETEAETDSGENGDDETTPEPAAEEEGTTTTTEAPANNRKRRQAENSGEDAESDLETNVVEIMLKSLQEVDSSGNVVGANKANSQAMASFDDETFTIETPNEDATIPNSKKTEGDDPISAVMVSYMKGPLTIMVYIAKEDGTITLGSDDNTEETEVKQGQIRFAFHIEGWVWCTEGDGNCMDGETKQVGSSLDLVVAVKGEGEATEDPARTWDIGNGNFLYVSNMIDHTKNDDTTEFVAMAENYPMIEKAVDEEDISHVTMRFPTFQKSVLYGADVRLKIPGGEGVSSGSTLAASLAVVMLALLAAFLRV